MSDPSEAAMAVDVPAASSAVMDTSDAVATAQPDAAAAAAESGDGDAEVTRKEKKKKHKEKKEKKHKKEKKRKKHRSSDAAEEAAPAEEEEEEPEEEEEEESEESSESSDDDEDGQTTRMQHSRSDMHGDLTNDEAELDDPEERRRRRERRARKAAKKKAKAAKGGDKKRRKRPAGAKFVDDEVEVSSDEEVSEDEDDVDEADGFIKDLVVPDEEIDQDVRRSHKRKRGRRIRDEEVDAEDINLLKENLGLTVRTTNIDQDIERSEDDDDDDENQGTRKRSRLKKGAVDSAIDYTELARQKREQERLERQRRARGGLDELDMDEEDDFLAPEDDGSTMGGHHHHKRQSKRMEEDDNIDSFVEDDTKVMSAAPAGGEFSSKQRERLRELFGSVTSFFQTKRGTKTGGDDSDGAYGEEGEEAAPEEDSSAESEGEREIERKRKARLAAKAGAKPSRQVQRETRITELRTADIPERLQARHKKRQDLVAGLDAAAEHAEREDEAVWIFEQMFRAPLSISGGATTTTPHFGLRAESPLLPTLMTVLQYLQEDHLEIQFIASYRREHWCGEMMPPEARLTEDELMRVDELDEKWIELGARRMRLVSLLRDYESSDAIRQLHDADAAGTGARDWNDHATPSANALAEWRRLLSQRELTGNLELDDVQDALTVLGIIGSCRKRQMLQKRRDMRDFARRQRREQRETRAREKAEAATRRAEEREKRRIELSNSFEAGMAAAMDEDEPEEPVDEEPEEKSDPEIDEADDDVMADAAEAVLPHKKGRSTHKYQSVTKAWSITGTPELASAIGLTPSELAENLSYNFAKHHPRDSAWNVDYLAEDAIRYQKVKSVEEALACARRYAAFLIATDPLVRRHVRKEFMEQAEVWTFPTAKGIREIDETHEYFSVKRLVQKPVPRMNEHPAQFLLIHQAQHEGFIRAEFRLPRNPDTVNRVASLAMEDAEADTITANLCSLYLSPSTTSDARQWNQERRLVIHDAMATFLMPMCQVYATNILLKHAMEFVSKQIGKKLTQQLGVRGFQPPVPAHTASHDEDGKKKKKSTATADTNWRIFSIIVGDQWTPTHIAVLNRYGGVIDHLVLHFLKSNAQARSRTGEAQSESDRNQYMRKKEDTRKLLEFVASHQPKLIVVDATSMECRAFKDELTQKTLLDYPAIRVEWMDPEVSRIYMNSARAELEFKEYPRNLRQAVSMGRQALDPIAELAGLYAGPIDAEQWAESANTSAQLMHSIQSGRNEDEALKKDVVAAATNALQNDMLALSLHPLQRALPTRLLLATMQRVFVRHVNYVGVDINKIVQRPWLTGSLQFVNGLGPVKAKYLLDYAKRHGYIASREELLNKVLAAQAEEKAAALIKSEDGRRAATAAAAQTAAAAAAAAKGDTALFGPCIYRNCSAFLIIRRNAAMDAMDDLDAHPLDETRVHPENYPQAQQVALDALEISTDAIDEEATKLIAKEKKKLRKADADDDADLFDEDGEIDEAKRRARDEARHSLASEAAHTKVVLKHIRTVMEPLHSQQLQLLDLEAADQIAREEAPGAASTLETLQQIVSELIDPFADIKRWFAAFASPSAHRLFYLLTGETSRTLREGMIAPVVINGIHPQGKGAYVRLDSGIRGFLAMRSVSDNAPQGARRDQFSDPNEVAREIDDNLKWLKARLTPGLNINARIVRIEKDRFSVELSTRSSDLNQAQWIANADARLARQQEMAAKWGRANLDEVDEIEQSLYFNDPYLFVGTHQEDAGVLAAEAGPQRAEKRFRQRNITHTLFRNVSREDAIASLQDKSIGEVVVRPSSIGTNHLTLTWKVSDQDVSTDAADRGIYFHVDIKEEQKPNELEIGTKLIVREGKYVYEDLDEIVARFIQPMVKWVNDLTAHKNFRFGNEAEIHGILFAEKQQDRNKFPYALHFATSKEKVGAFQFSFLPNAEVRASSFVVVPEGYLYRERTYSSVNSLLAAIKAEMSKRVGVAPPPGSTQAAKYGSTSNRPSSRAPPPERSLPPYAGAAAAAATTSRPPYAAPAANVRPPPSSLPPYAGAAAGGSMPPYAGASGPPRPQYGAPPSAMPPYAGAPAGAYGAPLPQPPRPAYPPYQQQPPQSYQQPPPPQQQLHYPPYGAAYPPMLPQQQQPPAPQPAAPAGGATSGFVHPSRLGIVSHSQGPPQPPQQQQQQPARSRWGGTVNSRNDDMQM